MQRVLIYKPFLTTDEFHEGQVMKLAHKVAQLNSCGCNLRNEEGYIVDCNDLKLALAYLRNMFDGIFDFNEVAVDVKQESDLTKRLFDVDYANSSLRAGIILYVNY